MQRRIILYSIFFIFLLINTIDVLGSTPSSKIDNLRQSVLALDSAWTRALGDLQQRKKTGDLEAAEKKDYAKFITYLSGRIDHYCTLLKTEGGEQATANLPCTESTAIASTLEQPPATTKTEEIADLDKSLTEALGEFDEQLLKEDLRIAARMPTERESERSYSEGSGSSGQNGSGQYRAGGKTGTAGSTGGQEISQSSSASTQNGQSSTASSSGKGAGVGSTEQKDDTRTGKHEISSGYDDIVARQLREAAEKETDPELKEKLWEEYRKYKEGVN